MNNQCHLFILAMTLLPGTVCSGSEQSNNVSKIDMHEIPFSDRRGSVASNRNEILLSYTKEALAVVISEANRIAKALKLKDSVPITVTQLVEAFVPPPGYSKDYDSIGNITTSNYSYYITRGNKLCYVVKTHQEEDGPKWQNDYSWPVDRVDTNAANALAMQWFTAASIDIDALDRDLTKRVYVANKYLQPPPGHFVPIYAVGWFKRSIPNPDIVLMTQKWPEWEAVVSAVLLQPTETLIQLRVEDTKYILTKPLTLTNLAAALHLTATAADLKGDPP